MVGFEIHVRAPGWTPLPSVVYIYIHYIRVTRVHRPCTVFNDSATVLWVLQ